MADAQRPPAAPTLPAPEPGRAERLTGTVNGTIVTAGVLAVSSADAEPSAVDATLYTLATVAVFWLAHGWAHALGARAGGHPEHGLLSGLRNQLPVLEAALAPLALVAAARLLDAGNETAISIGVWACVVELAVLGGGIALREGAPAWRVVTTASGCALLGLAMVALKALIH